MISEANKRYALRKILEKMSAVTTGNKVVDASPGFALDTAFWELEQFITTHYAPKAEQNTAGVNGLAGTRKHFTI